MVGGWDMEGGRWRVGGWVVDGSWVGGWRLGAGGWVGEWRVGDGGWEVGIYRL